MLIATGDDDCKINLFNYPVFKKGAKSKSFIGHASHVTNVKFSHDLSILITLGGGDHTILQWKLNYSEDPILSLQDSDAEFTGTDTSDLEAIDSDLETEKSRPYVPR
ncbi:Echinoderm microtubule-associated protein-like 6 [Oopsacas minuta]|uniref:Echinoderm microtubule-associated protein-like 6 n=1 Tax=Oopsacas minuta TaxID=111878 RepID=A0AAV7JI18_9METZ|nr:Echinoderm microtubule-associated protein-like 6 [Oopsacas minuta]